MHSSQEDQGGSLCQYQSESVEKQNQQDICIWSGAVKKKSEIHKQITLHNVGGFQPIHERPKE